MKWTERLVRKKVEWEERLLIRQRKAFLDWIEKHDVLLQETVVVASADEVACFRYASGTWKKISVSDGKHFPGNFRFVLCESGMFAQMEELLGLVVGEWAAIFSAPTFEVWERKRFYEERHLPLPLRLGLDDDEKTCVTKEVRRMMGEVLADKMPLLSPDSSERWQGRQDLDVAVWVEGRLRASVIVIGQECREALVIGARRATWDKRFAPLTAEELPTARIEITLMSDLYFPVLTSDEEGNRIDPTKGYRVSLPGAQKVGWYLPEVHNVVSFPGLKNLLFRLATEKAGILPEQAGDCRYEQFPVFDWVEAAHGVMTLSGPTEAVSREGSAKEEARLMLERSVRWLCDLQERDGNIPAILSQAGVYDKRRLPALGCAGHALASYGRAFDDDRAVSAAGRLWEYMKRSLASTPEGTDQQSLFPMVYFLRLSIALGKGVENFAVMRLAESLDSLRNNPILWLQTLSLLVDYEGQGHTKYGHLLRAETKRAEREFYKKRDLTGEQLALYPELIAVCHGLWQLTGEAQWKETALRVSQWYSGRQQEDGSFPHSPGTTFAYTRGSSKIFEALACFPEENEKALRRALSWIQTMQYTESNTFFMNKQEQEMLVGGFRHDAFNRQAWIDASAHVILGMVRLWH